MNDNQFENEDLKNKDDSDVHEKQENKENEKEEPKTAPELNIENIKELLPQYCIARKPAPLTGENRTMLDHKKAEFTQLCNRE